MRNIATLEQCESINWHNVARSSGSNGRDRVLHVASSQPRLSVVSWMQGTRLARSVFSSPRFANTSISARRAFHVGLMENVARFVALFDGVKKRFEKHRIRAAIFMLATQQRADKKLVHRILLFGGFPWRWEL